MAVGLDCGTAFYIAAREDSIKKERNAFLTIDGDAASVKRMLLRKKIPFVERNKRVHIVGKHAFEYAQIFGNSELKRPMKSGLLNPTERDALPVLKGIIHSLLGDPKEEGELCVYCVPSKPIDVESLVDYHEDVLANIISSLGYTPRSLPEANALAYEGLIDDDLTGISISMGAGMCNLSIMYQGIAASNFSVSKGGDFIDEHVSMDTGVPPAKCQYVKEDPSTNLGNTKVQFDTDGPKVVGEVDQTNVQTAIKTYYGVLINYLLANLNKRFEADNNIPNFPNPVPIVIGGGTSMVPGFIEYFKQKYAERDLPIDLKDISLVSDTHNAVAKGCLSEALLG
tara:strand:- start:2702 stop:3721 length:1020 start_codon:yes stop_codon:yes gene_type:complete